MSNVQKPVSLSRDTKEVVGSVRRVLATVVQHLPSVDDANGLLAVREVLSGQVNVLTEIIDSLESFSDSRVDGAGNIISERERKEWHDADGDTAMPSLRKDTTHG